MSLRVNNKNISCPQDYSSNSEYSSDDDIEYYAGFDDQYPELTNEYLDYLRENRNGRYIDNTPKPINLSNYPGRYTQMKKYKLETLSNPFKKFFTTTRFTFSIPHKNSKLSAA
jgi:hypothetical protein